MRKPFVYLSEVLQATGGLYQNREELIKFPPVLKDAENQLNHIRITMERNVRAAKEAEQRKNDLIVYLAHDLKTPLTSVIGYLTLLEDEPQISEELRQKYLQIALTKSEHLEDLINEFFEITRFNLSNLTLEVSSVNLTRMLEQITYEFKPLLTEKQLSFRLQMPKDYMMKCDVGKMQRVFDNLFRNAVNYSFPGGEIVVTVTEKENRIHIACENQGNTIPKEKLARIFEQFYRLDTRGDSGRVVREAVDVRVEEAQRNGPSERTGRRQPVGDYGAGAGRRRGLDAWDRSGRHRCLDGTVVGGGKLSAG